MSQSKLPKSYWFWRERLYRKIELHRLKNKKLVLDIGCGNGDDAFSISKIAKKVYAFDIEQSIQWKAYASLQLTFRVANAEKMPFKDNTFDGVYIKDVLHHVSNPKKVLSEIRRVAKSDALILIVEANRYNPLFYIHMTKMLGHEHFSRDYFINLIREYFDKVRFKQFESHYIPTSNLLLAKVITYMFEFMFERNPLLQTFQSYNLAIVEKSKK